jgi:alkanesulfonate monooxygenase SsuD/methylene tetrahydromethanopterin reductase-like flavin-dependent oxidoreductase (luciferase family)
MKVGILQEGEILPGVSPAQRYREMIEEVALADKMGFYSWGTSEQHFSPPRFTVSAPEVLYAAVSQHTRNIKLRIMCSVLLKWNHPILIAERLATLDAVSNGRAEIATARSNNLTTLAAFGVDPKETKEQWEDSLALLIKALSQDEVEHDGPFWKVPKRQIVPRCEGRVHPPISVAASSVETHRAAGHKGIGCLAFENYFGFDYLQECIEAFRKAQKTAEPIVPEPCTTMGLYVATAFCAKTRQEAVRVARDAALGYFKFILDLYVPLGKRSSYEYLDARMTKLLENEGNIDFLLNETPSVLIGSPEDYVRRLRGLDARGVDEVLLRIDGVPHEDIMRSIELIGREVLPHVSRDIQQAAE